MFILCKMPRIGKVTETVDLWLLRWGSGEWRVTDRGFILG